METILVISNSLIVNELLKLIFNKREESLEFINENEIDELTNTTVIIDDAIPNLETLLATLKKNKNRVILLGDSNFSVDYSIDKPFLPKDIESIFDDLKKEKKIDSSKIKTNVLDPDEIAHIKALMALDEEEEQNQESTQTPLEKLQSRVSFKSKGKEAKEFLLSLLELDKNELKKLLKKSKVSIKVTFKEANNE